MSKLKSVVTSAMNAKTINKKASNLLVDNFGIGYPEVSVYGGTEYAINRFKEQYPTIMDGSIENAKGTMEWDIATTWTGLGFKFEPYINYIKLSATATIWLKDEEGDEIYKEEEIELPVEDYEIKVRYEKSIEDDAVVEFKRMEIYLRKKEIKVYFNV